MAARREVLVAKLRVTEVGGHLCWNGSDACEAALDAHFDMGAPAAWPADEWVMRNETILCSSERVGDFEPEFFRNHVAQREKLVSSVSIL